MTTFNWLPASEFMQDIFETKPFHMRDVLPSKYYSIKDLNASLTASLTSALPFTIGMHGRVPSRNDYCTEVFNPYKHSMQLEIDPRKVENFLKKGANLKIQRFATLSEKVLSVVTDIETWLGFTTSANGYFSFGTQRGLPVHWDHHDIIAVQLIGKKNWKISRPAIELPIKAHRSDADPPPNPASVYMETQLEAGDALYVPRGWWHDVSPVKDEKTLHLAVGLHPPHKSDFLLWVVSQEILRNVEFRKTLLRDKSNADFNSILATLGTALNNPEVVAKYREHYEALIRPVGVFKLDEPEQ